ncbi:MULTISPECIES: DUF6916 family protein [Pseudomonas aeruginosa group]|uniref:DUF6916 family protein n=1 Tax=Pseudomonas aeruginosa group TaxID=136841 RepID=UPI001F27EBCA|nr:MULTISPECIES: hypothetical protein [Pseudomonas aeruginosa group]MCP1649851.1 hypothetical protein [Pseudomonas nitroreducens]MCP1687420.1 hypothetical protein [Pseudomonas nitroreducens]
MLIDLEGLTAQSFSSELGQLFTAHTVPNPVQLTLHNVIEGRAAVGGFRTPFTLVFTSPLSVLLLEAHYRLSSPSGRDYEMYLAPLAATSDGQRHYQALFN